MGSHGQGTGFNVVGVAALRFKRFAPLGQLVKRCQGVNGGLTKRLLNLGSADKVLLLLALTYKQGLSGRQQRIHPPWVLIQGTLLRFNGVHHSLYKTTMYQRQPLVAPLPTLTSNFAVPTIGVAAWFDPLLPAPDSQNPLYAGQNQVRRLNGPKGNTSVDQDYAEYRTLYALYLDQRIPFRNNNPRAISLVDGVVDPTYQAMWNALDNTIEQLAQCNYVHDFGGSYTRILDTAHGVDVTAPRGGGMPLKGWGTVEYDTQARQYDTEKQETRNAGTLLQTFESHYASVDRPIPDGGTLVIVKNPATTQRYKSMLWAAVRGH